MPLELTELNCGNCPFGRVEMLLTHEGLVCYGAPPQLRPGGSVYPAVGQAVAGDAIRPLVKATDPPCSMHTGVSDAIYRILFPAPSATDEEPPSTPAPSPNG